MRNLKRALSLTLASVMLLGMMVVGTSAAGYPDVDNDDNIEAIEVLQAVQVMRGDENGNFDPDRSVTRAEMAVVMALLLNLDYEYYESTCPFTDVPAWARPYVGACYANKIVSGYNATTYGANDTVTAVQAASMMMRALGYFQYAEDYADGFEVATVRQGTSIGIFNDVGSNATAAMTRNQVAQMALNALQSDMVAFKGDTGWEINGIKMGYRADYQSRTGTASKYNALKNNLDRTDINNQGQYYIQLGEELYDGKLTKKSDTDTFDRPATTWRYDGKDIGTYADGADATYTKKVEAGDIYSDLGLGSTIEAKNVVISVDGDEEAVEAVAIKKGSSTKIGESGNGVLTEVYYDKDNNSVKITQIKTYIGEINRTVAASGSKAAYVEVNTSIDTYGVTPSGASAVEKFETDAAFADEDKVLYTFSVTDDAIQSVQLAETVTGNVSQVVNKANDQDNSNLTMDGTKYDASATMARSLLSAVSVDQDYTLYLDSYGYVISVSEEEYTDYALILAVNGAAGKKDDLIHSNQAKLVFTDGTVRVVNTDKNYESGTGAIESGKIVTYKEKTDGTYTLKEVSSTQSLISTKDPEPIALVSEPEVVGNLFDMKSERAVITVDESREVYGNSSSMIVVYNNDSDDWDSYTGIKNAPTVKSKALSAKDGSDDYSYGTEAADKERELVSAYWYCKNGSIVTAMFILPGDDRLVENDNNNLLFLAGQSVSDRIHNSLGDYYEYQAVVNGGIETVKVTEGLGNALNGLYSRYTTNSDGIITSVDAYTTTAPTADNKTSGKVIGYERVSGTYTILAGVDNDNDKTGFTANDGVVTRANEGIWTAKDDCKFYAIDKDGNISESRINSVGKSAVNRLYYIIDGKVLTYVFVETVEEKDDTVAPTVTITASKANPNVGDEVTLTADVTLNDPKNDYIYRYEWYKGNGTKLTDIDDVEELTRISYSSTSNTFDKVDTDAGGDIWYYCVVTVRNDEVEGNSTAKAFGSCRVAVTDRSTMTIRIIVLLDDKDDTIEETKTVSKTEAVDGKVTVRRPVVNGYECVSEETKVTFKAGGTETVYYSYEKLGDGEVTPQPGGSGQGEGGPTPDGDYGDAYDKADVNIEEDGDENTLKTYKISGSAENIVKALGSSSSHGENAMISSAVGNNTASVGIHFQSPTDKDGNYVANGSDVSITRKKNGEVDAQGNGTSWQYNSTTGLAHQWFIVADLDNEVWTGRQRNDVYEFTIVWTIDGKTETHHYQVEINITE